MALFKHCGCFHEYKITREDRLVELGCGHPKYLLIWILFAARNCCQLVGVKMAEHYQHKFLTCISICICSWIFCVCICIFICSCTLICICICVCMCICICVCLCLYLYLYLCLQSYKHTNTNKKMTAKTLEERSNILIIELKSEWLFIVGNDHHNQNHL